MQTTTFNFTEQDAHAVGAVRAGDAERYRELVERHERRVYAVAWSRLGDAALAEEVTQEAFIRAYRGLALLADGAKFAGWINSIARNIAINFGIRHRRELNKRERWAVEQEPSPELPSPAAEAEEADAPCTPETLRQALAELPATHRECLVLFYLEGKSGADAAAALGISETAIRVRLHRARAALRERLEERLADSLGKLGPGKTLVPAIMAGVLTSASAKAATGGGGAVILGTLAKLAPFKWLLPFFAVAIGALPGMALTTLTAKAEQRNFRDPQGFRAQASRAMHRTIFWVVPLVTIPIVIGTLALIKKLGPQRTDWILAVVMVGCLAWAWRMLGMRNRFQRGMVIWYGILGGGMVLKAVGLISANAYTYCFIASSLWLTWIIRWRPTRMDNSLFFRAMMGMLELPSPATPATTPTARLEKADLKRFGKFLADRHLINALRWRPEGLLLRQGFTKLPWPADKAAQFKAALPFSPRDSANVLLHWNGEVTAQISEANRRTQHALNTEEAALRSKVEAQVAVAVTHAWQGFRDGNIPAAERALGEGADSEIFHVPPAHAASTRWLQVTAALPAVLFSAMLIVSHYPQILKPFFGRHPKVVPYLPFSELQVRAMLAQVGEAGVTGSNALRRLDGGLSRVEVWPAKTLFSSNGWKVLREHLLVEPYSLGDTAAQRAACLLDTPDLLRAVANDWFRPQDFGLTPEDVRSSILDASPAARRHWFAPQEVPGPDSDGTSASYTTLNVEMLAGRVQCLKRFGCLDAADGSAAVEVLLEHQILSEQRPAGRRKLPFPELLHGTFLTVGTDPIVDTYYALVVLEGFGSLDRLDREACIQGILRFHHGKGMFKSLKPNDGLVTFMGYSRDTFCAFESLRMLGALDRVTDLDHWRFWPKNRSKLPTDRNATPNLTGSEIEAWELQRRLARIVEQRKLDPAAPPRSLLEP